MVRLLVTQGSLGNGQLHQTIYERQNKEGKTALSCHWLILPILQYIRNLWPFESFGKLCLYYYIFKIARKHHTSFCK